MPRPRLLAGLTGVVVLVAVGLGYYFSTSAPDADTLATSGLIAVVEKSTLRVIDGSGKNAGAVGDVPVDGTVAWSTDGVSIGYGRGDTLYWSPTNLQFSRKISTIKPGSRFFFSPTGKEVLVQTDKGVSIVDKADKQIWHTDGGTPLGWWNVTGLVGQAVVVGDGTRIRILSTYNSEALWTLDAMAAYPSPTGPTLLLQRGDGWALWDPLTGARPIPGVDKSGSAAWDPTGQRVAIEGSASGNAVVVTAADLKSTSLGVAGAVNSWTNDRIAIARNGVVDLVRPGASERQSFAGATFASGQPAAPKQAGTPGKPGRVAFTQVARATGGLLPIATAQSPDGKVLYVADLAGRVVADVNGQQTTVLDIRDQITVYEESGLLGFTLDPDFPKVRTAYIYYGVGGVVGGVDKGIRRNIIASFEIGADGVSPVPNSLRTRWSVTAPQQSPISHNGGTIAFGTDRLLYLGIGDMGDHEAAALANSAAGSFYSFDTTQSGEWKPTTVAYGFRNPFRFTVDPVTSQIWIGDVGGINREEVDILTRGGNFGWPLREGEICRANQGPCDAPGLAPVHAFWPYALQLPCGAGIIGGYLYRGGAMPNLQGWYIFGDLCAGEIRAINSQSPGDPFIVLGRAPSAPSNGSVVQIVPDAKGEPLVVGGLESPAKGVWRLGPEN